MQRLLVAQHNQTGPRWYVQNLSQFFLAPKEPGAGSAVAGGASRKYHLYLILSLIGVGDTQKLRAYRNLSIIGDCLASARQPVSERSWAGGGGAPGLSGP